MRRFNRTFLAAASLAMALGAAAAAQPTGGGVDPQRLALAEKIYVITGRQTLDAVDRALKTMLSGALSTTSGQDPARAAALKAALGDSLDDFMPRIMRQTALIMAQDFTVEQLQAMLAFYQSPTGQAVLQKMPLITRQAMQTSNGLLPAFMQKFEADYCGRVACTDQDRQVFAQVNAHMAHGPAAGPSAPGPNTSGPNTSGGPGR